MPFHEDETLNMGDKIKDTEQIVNEELKVK
jgi:hypothetical protein